MKLTMKKKEYDLIMDKAHERGVLQTINAVIASLKSYPFGGGHSEIMAEIGRIVKESKVEVERESIN